MAVDVNGIAAYCGALSTAPKGTDTLAIQVGFELSHALTDPRLAHAQITGRRRKGTAPSNGKEGPQGIVSAGMGVRS